MGRDGKGGRNIKIPERAVGKAGRKRAQSGKKGKLFERERDAK